MAVQKGSNHTPKNRRPAFLLRLVLSLGIAILLSLLLTRATPTAAQIEIPEMDEFYGINFVPPVEPWLTLAKNSGAGTVRWQFSWRDLEPNPGEWHWEGADRDIQGWQEAGIGIHALLHNPPDFALADPGGGLMPKNIDLPWDHPENYWSHYCYEFANRYKGQIASYEIWNEPDLEQFWQGTPEQYFYIMRSCYQAIKAADPGKPVAMAGMALLIERDFFPTVVRMAANDPNGQEHNYYFDAANIHMYASTELVYDLLVETQGVLEQYGMGYKPIWITETNIAISSYAHDPGMPAWAHASEEEAGWYILEAIMNAHAGGAERFMIFRLHDADMDVAYGLLTSEGRPRATYRALQLAATFMVDIEEANREVIDDDVVIVTLKRADGGRVIGVWSLAGRSQTVKIPAELNAAILVKASGSVSTVTRGVDGQYEVTLAAVNRETSSRPDHYGIGGPPAIIVEQDTDAPTVTIEAEPLRLDDTQIMIRWSGDDGEFGTGIDSYEIEISRDGGPWEVWQAGFTETEATYDLSEGGQVEFRVRAVDRAGNVGEFSQATQPISLRPVGQLAAQILDLRGQPVPFARVTLGDGTLHDADETGVVRISLPPGTARITRVDGSAHGQANPAPVEIRLGEEHAVEWILIPPSLLSNGSFDLGLQGWRISSPVDVETGRDGGSSVLRLSGQRRPWGSPAASISVAMPPDYEDGLLYFTYRLPDPGDQTFLVRAITVGRQSVLWQSQTAVDDMTPVALDVGQFAGEPVSLRFELWGPKGAAPGTAEIDNLILGNVPVLPPPED
jgi:hypothetical protein